MSVAVRDADAIDGEVEPGRTARVDQPDRIRTHPCAASMARRLVGLAQGDGDALVQRRFPAASTSPKCRFTWASVRVLRAGAALPAVGCGIPMITEDHSRGDRSPMGRQRRIQSIFD
jgi:hypothetical protein